MSKLLNPGDKVFIKNKEDILSSLDENGMSKNGIKFYEDMEECCGSEFWIGRKGEAGYFLVPPKSSREWDIEWFIPTKLHITIDPREMVQSVASVYRICEAWSE